MNLAAGIYRVFRAVLVTTILCAVGIPALLYIALSLPNVQEEVRDIGQKELSKLLSTEVSIGDLAFSPFNRVTLFNVKIADDNGRDAVTISRLGAGINLIDLVFRGKFVVNYAEVIGLDGHISREDQDSPINISRIIRQFKSDKDNKKQTNIELGINTVVLRQCAFSYDILSAPTLQHGNFDKNHISLYNINADVTIPVVSDKAFNAELFRITFSERAGFTVTDLHGKFSLLSDTLSISNFSIALPNSDIKFNDISIPLDSTRNWHESISRNPVKISLLSQSYLNPSDLSSFSPLLAKINGRLNIALDLTASTSSISLDKLRITSITPHISINAEGNATGISSLESLNASIKNLSVVAMGADIQRIIKDRLPDASWLNRLGLISVKGNLSIAEKHMSAKLNTATQCGKVDCVINGVVRSSDNNEILPISIDSKINWDNIDLGKLLTDNKFGCTNGEITTDFVLSGDNNIKGNAAVAVKSLQLGYTTLENLKLNASGDNSYLNFSVISPNSVLDMNASGEIKYKNKHINHSDIRAEIVNFSPSALGIKQKRDDISYSGRMIAGMSGSSLNDVEGVCTFGNIRLTDSIGSCLLGINSIVLTASGESESREIKLRSDFVDLDLAGSYDVTSIPATLQAIAAKKLPSLFNLLHGSDNISKNRFSISASIKETESFADTFRLPASLMYPMMISGHVDGSNLTASLEIDAPYIRQGNKLIENTSVKFNSDTALAVLTAETKVPTKDGLMSINIDNTLVSDSAHTSINWSIDRKRAYKGKIGFSTGLSRLDDSQLVTTVNILPGEMEFNDTVWTVAPSSVTAYGKERIIVDHLNVSRYGQFVRIDGAVSSSADDRLKIDLSNVNLDYIFESLGIDKARIGGDATGTFTASALLSPEPHFTTSGLDVKNISYNATVLGNAIVKSSWDGERRAITLSADIDQPNGKMSKIDGAIFPLNDSLDISFDAKEINIGFLKPFMEAFTSDVQGRASGQAHLWGNFKYIDFEGRLHADSIRMKIDFTNTWYTACDSVIITPGLIDLHNITLRDEYNNTAMLNGYVKHTFFKAPEFEFNITDANHMLVYDETEKRNPDWYGRVFANGKAAVKGGPGWVNITADMSTASQSVFTFVLSDIEEAGEYSFITFRNRDLLEVADTIVANPTPALVRDLRKKLAQKEEAGASRYDMDFSVTMTPEAQLVIVMDPVGGDRIRTFGSGTIRMQYGSTDEELRMYGTYTLERGSYNFTLQDIIIKDFSIRDGSSIAFTGDPFSAVLDITAVYALNANLSDLDESFLQDRDLNRTNVPVHAILKVTGDLQQPDIAFDLEFPTLPSDTYRKVKSIVSTDEMMNRQIIYLLALSRFYTPDYVGATRGNELVSVASSTLSSQLSNILGQINDKWSIAPNFRSDKGDFSDLEVDLALSSQLLNNRLLFNGNFGYRDNTLNNNQFIGDFDIEYLLNRRGTLRLKAYNRYNDRNYYVKTATTTQGVGIVLRHDFDNFLSFLKKFRKKDKNKSIPADTTRLLPEPTFPDSIR